METGVTPQLFVVNTVKQRDSNKQICDPQFASDFGLDRTELQRFIDWIQE
jgi:hypothetical protein